jgi:S-DNA-T family DNA segregation ATPase FtsK/SpoIIIE
MGMLGARLSYTFVHNGFGFAAFALLPWLALTGLYLLFAYRPFSLLRIGIHTILFTVWFSLFFGFIFQKLPSLHILGGTFGFFGVQKLNLAIGGIGTFFLLLAYAVIYSIVFLNLNPFSRIKMPATAPIPQAAATATDKTEAPDIILDVPLEPEAEEEELPLDLEERFLHAICHPCPPRVVICCSGLRRFRECR